MPPRLIPVLAVRCWRHAGWSLRMRRQTGGTYVVEFQFEDDSWHAIPGDHATPNKARIAGNAWAVTARESVQERPVLGPVRMDEQLLPAPTDLPS